MPGRDWLEDVERWIAAVVGTTVRLEVTRERAWGVIVRVTTPDRVLFFKEPASAGRHESVIVADIAERWPGLVPDVVAADHDRAWLLMEDHGVPMRDSVAPDKQIEVFEEILPRYADVQRASRPMLHGWMSAGVPDRRVERLPALVDDLLAGRSRIGVVPLPPEQRALIESAQDDLARVVDELAPTEFAVAIDHSDLHDGNVLVGRDAPRVIDWGDGCISHPFASLFVVFQHAVARSAASGRRRASLRLRDVYLDPWKPDASMRELHEAFAHATWLGYVIRALNFVHMMGEESVEECRQAVAEFLVRWAEKCPLLDDPDELVAAIADQTEY